jgi:DNA-binding response OmpR family regulator
MINGNTEVLIIDDDDQLAEAVELFLMKSGYQIRRARNGQEGLRQVYHRRPDLILLDIMMPKLDGWEVCSRIREVSDVPIVMLTARGQEMERVRGLKLGADDYVTKPFSLVELDARIEAILRRSNGADGESNVVYDDGRLVIDPESGQVRHAGEPLDLTATEKRMLFYFAANAGRVLSHDQLLEEVWGPEYVGSDDYVKLYVWRIRQKVEADPSNPEYLLTERGMGYRFRRAEAC